MKYEMKLQNLPFVQIKNGTKKYELRLNDEKRQKLKVGDYIEFTNIKTSEKIITKIKDIIHFENFEKLYKELNKIDLGYLPKEVALPSDMELYYSKKEQEKYGTLAIEIELIK